MKTYFLLFVLSCGFYASSQSTSNALISEISLSNYRLMVENADPLNNLKSAPKGTTDSTPELKKLRELELMILKLEKSLKDSLTASMTKLPSMVNQQQLDAIKSLTLQNEALIQEKKNLEIEKARLMSEKNTLSADKIKAEGEKNAALAVKSSEWESYISNYLKKEKFISDDLYNKLKSQISSNNVLKNDLDVFQIQSKRLAAAEDFLYAGKGDFKTVYTNFKMTIDASKYPEQASSQKEFKAMFDLFLIIADGLADKLNVIKESNTESLRTDELQNWRYYKLAINFPYLKDLIQRNFVKHTPLNFDPKNP